MLIASRFKRPETPITIGDEAYFFKPINPADAGSIHVCEVKDPAHIQRFMAITEGYYIPPDDQVAAQSPKLAARPSPGAGLAKGADAGKAADKTDESKTPVPPKGDLTSAVVPVDDEVREQAAALADSSSSWQKLRSIVSAGGIPIAVLHEAHRMELTKPEDQQRTTVLKILSTALEEAKK